MRGWRAALAVASLVLVLPSCSSRANALPACATPAQSIFVLMAQAVPSATMLPCVAALPVGWSFGGSQVQNGMARLWLDSDRAGSQAVEVELVRSCVVNGATAAVADRDEAGADVFTRQLSTTPTLRAERVVVFEGGCVTYRYDLAPTAAATLAREADDALSFVPRSTVNAAVCRDLGLALNGADAEPCREPSSTSG